MNNTISLKFEKGLNINPGETITFSISGSGNIERSVSNDHTVAVKAKAKKEYGEAVNRLREVYKVRICEEGGEVESNENENPNKLSVQELKEYAEAFEYLKTFLDEVEIMNKAEYLGREASIFARISRILSDLWILGRELLPLALTLAVIWYVILPLMTSETTDVRAPLQLPAYASLEG